MRIVFMGSPAFAVPALDALAGAGHQLVAAYCQPPRAAGRGQALRPTAVHARAAELGIEVRHPSSLKGESEQQAFAALGADVAVVAAYGLILPPPILDAPRLGCINLHASLLPRWRGAAPVQRAILAGDQLTGMTLMQMDAGLDTGPMRMIAELAIGRRNAGELAAALAKLGAAMIVELLANPTRFPPRPQPAEGATYAAKLRKEEARIDWARDAVELERQCRAFAPTPGAWFELDGERIKLLAAETCEASGAPGEVLDEALSIACGAGAIRPLLVQRAGRSPLGVAEFLRGRAVPRGTRLQ